MKLLEMHDRLLGDWTGNNLLRLSWLPDPDHHSPSTMSVTRAANGHFLVFTYTWVYEGEPQEGWLLVGNNNEQEQATAAFVDSWHMNGKVMACQGTVGEDSVISLLGSYEAPPGPDWGWRIVITPGEGETLGMTMYNITPDGQEDLAVQADYTRATV
jgi:hypothetical protein